MVHLLDQVRTGQREHVMKTLERFRVIAQEMAAETRLVQAFALQHRPHRPVQDDDPLGERSEESGPAPLCGAHSRGEV